jgi:hypothetical protein
MASRLSSEKGAAARKRLDRDSLGPFGRLPLGQTGRSQDRRTPCRSMYARAAGRKVRNLALTRYGLFAVRPVSGDTDPGM